MRVIIQKSPLSFRSVRCFVSDGRLRVQFCKGRGEKFGVVNVLSWRLGCVGEYNVAREIRHYLRWGSLLDIQAVILPLIAEK